MLKPLIAICYGTRPEAIKLAPLILRLKSSPYFKSFVISTGQHVEMLGQVHAAFGFSPDQDLAVHTPNQNLNQLVAKITSEISELLSSAKPDFLVVQGDTVSALSSALAAFNLGVPVAHVEAGLRSHDLKQPFPEEGYRKLISAISSLHFAPTSNAVSNLLNENVEPTSIFKTGNTVIDALLDQKKIQGISPTGHTTRKNILVTAHRRENWGQPILNVLESINELVDLYPDLHFQVVLHANPELQKTYRKVLKESKQIELLSPLDYKSLISKIANAWLILTDSGGIQEEAPALGVPVFVLRNTTERPEGVGTGNARLVGTDKNVIKDGVTELLENPPTYLKMSQATNPYGDGMASERIIEALKNWFGIESTLDDFRKPN